MDLSATPPAQLEQAETGSGTRSAEIFVELAIGLAEGRDLTGLLHRLLESVIALTGANAGAVRLLSPGGESLRLFSDVGLPPPVRHCEATVESDCGTCGAAVAKADIALSDSLEICAKRSGAEFFGGHCRQLVAVPLQHRGRVLGVYNLFLPPGLRLPPQAMSILRSVGELLGLVLDNIRLEAENVKATRVQERQMMAAEIHDSIAQTLTFVKMRLPLLEDALNKGDGIPALRYLEDVRKAVGEAHGSLRQIITHFRTSIDPNGLAYALQALIAGFRDRCTLQFGFNCNGLQDDLAADVQTETFLIVQEALSNAVRHSGAQHVWLTVNAHGKGFELTVDDDGIGVESQPACADTGAHFGIKIMSERAQRLGAAFSVGDRPGGGTRVRLSWNPSAGATP